MMSSNLRDSLHSRLTVLQKAGRDIIRWQFTKQDEVRLFEFIHPSVNTRDPSFRLFNLPATFDADQSGLVEHSGHFWTLLQTNESHTSITDVSTLFEGKPLSAENQRKAQAIQQRGGLLRLSRHGVPYDELDLAQLSPEERTKALQILNSGGGLGFNYGFVFDDRFGV